MSKKSNREKRKAKKQKAIDQGSPAALRSLAERNLEAGARAVLRILQSSPSKASDPEISSLSEYLCERLRAIDAFELALQLATAFERRSPRFCLEEALAAFALGDDERAQQAASCFKIVQSALAPVLAVATETKVPRTPPGASPALRGVIALARCAMGLRSGKATNATTTLRQIPKEEAGRLFVTEMRQAAQVVAGRQDRMEYDALQLAKSSLARSNPRLSSAIAHCLADRIPKRFMQIVSQFPLPEATKADALLHASITGSGLDSHEARASLLIAKLGHEAFSKDQQAVAALYEGFALCITNPQRALKALDRAMELGADPVESLRGRYIAQQNLFMRPNANDSYLASHASHASHAARAARALASTAMRVHGLLAPHPQAAAFATVVAASAAEFLTHDPNPQRALDAIKVARATATQAGLLHPSLEANLLHLEALQLEHTHPQRALELVSKALELDNQHHNAWHLCINLTQALMGPSKAEDLVLQAADLNICSRLVSTAGSIRSKRGLPIPLLPGRAQPGEVALELKRRLDQEGWTAVPSPYDKEIAACRAALDPESRRALDLAAYKLLSEKQLSEGVSSLLRFLASEASETSKESPLKTLPTLISFGAASGWEGSVFEMVNTANTPASLTELAAQAIDSFQRAQQYTSSQKLLMGIAGQLNNFQLDRLKGKINLIPSAMVDPRVQHAAELLAPHFPLLSDSPVDQGSFQPMEFEEDDFFEDFEENPLHDAFFELMASQLPPKVVNNLEKDELTSILEQLTKTLSGAPNKKNTRKVEELCFRLGITPMEFLNSIAQLPRSFR